MKKRLTRGEKWLFAAPLLFLAIAGAAWQWKKTVPVSLNLSVSENVTALEFSPDGKRLIAIFADAKNNRHRGWIYDLESHQKICELAMPLRQSVRDGFENVAWSPDGKRIVAVAYLCSSIPTHRKVTVWDAGSGALKADQGYTFASSLFLRDGFHFSSDGKTLIGGGSPAAKFDAITGKLLNKPRPSEPPLARLTDDLELRAVFVNSGWWMYRFDVIDSKTKRMVLQRYVKNFDNVKVHDNLLCVIEHQKSYGERYQDRLLIWDGQTRKSLPSPSIPPRKRVVLVSLHPDKRTLVYWTHWSGLDGELIAWDYRAKRELWRTSTEENLFDMDWTPDGKWLTANTYADFKQFHLSVYDKTGKPRFTNNATDFRHAWSPDNKQLATISGKVDSAGIHLSNRLEIHRFEDE